MGFGQVSGPPATARQVEQLLTLLREAGHTDFRDARGPLGFTQRQAGGRFTRDEADAFIAALEGAEQSSGSQSSGSQCSGSQARGDDETATAIVRRATPAARPPSAARRTAMAEVLRSAPDELLGAELERRGWMVIEPLNP